MGSGVLAAPARSGPRPAPPRAEAAVRPCSPPPSWSPHFSHQGSGARQDSGPPCETRPHKASCQCAQQDRASGQAPSAGVETKGRHREGCQAKASGGGGRSFSSGYSPGDRRGGGSCSRRWTPSHARPAGHGVAPGSAPGRGVRGHAPTCRGAHETLDTGFIQNQGCIDPHGLTGEQDARNGRSPQWTRGRHRTGQGSGRGGGAGARRRARGHAAKPKPEAPAAFARQAEATVPVIGLRSSPAKSQVSGTVSENTARSARGPTEVRPVRPEGGRAPGPSSRGQLPGACIVGGSSCCRRTSGRPRLPAGGCL